MDDYPWERGIDKISDIAKETETQKVVNIRTFIEGNEFLDQPPRTEFVYGEMEKILGYSSDPEKIFSHNRPIKEYIGLFGKGSGKSTMGFLMELYLIYLLLSMKDPLGFFKIPRTDYLSFVNVSVAGKQAKEEYFIRMKNCLQEAPYFKEHYNIYDSKSVVSKAGTESKGNIYMKSDVIDFPKGLKAVSVHSHNESWEGKNILFWVLDEACISYDTMIRDVVTGERHSVEKWSQLEKGFNIESYDFENRKKVITKSLVPFKKGKTKIYEVLTKSGKRIQVARNHLFFSEESWKKLSDLKIGDKILIKDRVVCELCDQEFNSFGNHLKYSHGISFKNYQKKFLGSCYYSQKIIKLLRRKMKKRFKDNPELGKKLNREGNKPENWTKKRRKKISKSNKRRDFCISSVLKTEKWRKAQKKLWEDPEFRKKHSEISRKMLLENNPMNDPEIREKALKNAFKARNLRPNKEEKKLMEILCSNFPGEFSYTGDGKKIIGNKIPDFCCENRKKLIEYFGIFWHTTFVNKTKEKAEEERINHFIKYGYETLIVWSEELQNPEKIVEKVANYLRNPLIIYDEMIDIKYIGEKDFYDFTIPEYHNYFLKGILHHNSGFVSLSGQYNADKIYNTLTTSVREFPYLGLILSFPRLDEEHDWTFKKLKEAESVEGMEGNQKATWEVKPSIFYCGKRIPFTFTMPDGNVMTVDVPVEYKKQASTDPQNFLSTYMAIPGAGGGTFFEGFNFEIRPEQRLPIFEIDTYIVKKEKKYINKKIIKQNYSIRGEKVVLTLDQSETNCMASIILGHKEKICDESGKIRILIVVDIIILYRPDPEEELVVDNDNYIELILDIIDKVGGVDLVRMDHWNAVNLKQKLEKKNISVSTKGPRKTSYEKTRSVLLYGRMSLPNQVEEIKELSNELKALDKPVGNSKPHVLYGFQDPADCLAQLVEELWDETSLDMSEIPVGNVIVTPMSPGELKMSGEKDRVERMFGLKDKVEQVLQKKYTKAKALDRRMGVGNVVSYGGGSGNKPSSSSSDIKKRLEEIGKG